MVKSKEKRAEREGVKLRCQNCENEWVYKGQKVDDEGNLKDENDKYVTCSQCIYKVNIKTRTVENLDG